MSRRRKPRVSSPCVAERYNETDLNSRIIEFLDPETGAGGLIEFRRRKDGSLWVIPYQMSGNVKVVPLESES